MNQLSNKTLSEIVTDHYQTARVFENYGLDFCCKGKRSLAVACEEKEIDVENILRELNEAMQKEDSNREFNKMSLSELSEYIVRIHHEYVRLNAPQIFGYVQRVAMKHGDRYPHMQEVYRLFAAIREELELHMEKEEKILFPRIRLLELTAATDASDSHLKHPIEMMEHDHDQAGDIMARIRQLTNDYTAPETACTTHRLAIDALKAFEADLHTHVHLENNILFKKAIEKYSHAE
jgi:regulator of cell morphogenesis and NO signaling